MEKSCCLWECGGVLDLTHDEVNVFLIWSHFKLLNNYILGLWTRWTLSLLHGTLWDGSIKPWCQTVQYQFDGRQIVWWTHIDRSTTKKSHDPKFLIHFAAGCLRMSHWCTRLTVRSDNPTFYIFIILIQPNRSMHRLCISDATQHLPLLPINKSYNKTDS